MSERVLLCSACGSRVEHNTDTGIIVRIHKTGGRKECTECDRWLAGKPQPRAKRPGES